MEIELMELKLLNGNHTKYISFKRTKSKTKLGTLNFKNMNNVEARYEVLEDTHLLKNVIVRNIMQKVKYYLLNLKVDEIRLFVAV